MRLAELAGRRVAVWGAGREGRAALATLRRHLPELVPTLICPATEAAALAATPALALETRAPDAALLAGFDIVIKSPGIPSRRPEIAAARAAGTRFTSGTAIWFAENPQARVIAVTGTKGKSTVSALIAHGLRALGRRTALAGNIGLPLLELPTETAVDWHVLELSSFQTGDAPAVEVAVVNNLYDEHLDWHGNAGAYRADKLALAAVASRLVLNWTQPELVAAIGHHPHRVAFGDAGGWHVAEAALWRGRRRVLAAGDCPLPGDHNLLNLAAAMAAIEAADEDAHAAAASTTRFQPLPHRLQPLGERDGFAFVDDSIATTPAATLAALAAFAGREVTVLVGGHERGVDWSDFAAGAGRLSPLPRIVCMGANGGRIAAALAEGGWRGVLSRAGALADALQQARALTPVSGVVLLSPGAPSFDQFADYAARGREFARLAGFNTGVDDAITGLGIA